MKTNEKDLVQLSVIGEVASARWPANRDYRVGGDGQVRVLPGTGGICYSHQTGDSVWRLRGDHVEPGVTIKNPDRDDNAALNVLSCIGNEGRVISGDAKGARGIVTGKHGGVEHLLLDFPVSVLEKLHIGDKVQIRAVGAGLELPECPAITVMNCDPRLLAKWRPVLKSEKLEARVTHILPASIMGSGLGASSSHSGDYDIQMFDEPLVRKLRLDELRFGDLVAIVDADHTYGRRYLEGAVSIGVVVHSRSDVSGHGPGVTTLLTSKSGAIEPVLDPQANIGKYLDAGRWRRDTGGRGGSKRGRKR